MRREFLFSVSSDTDCKLTSYSINKEGVWRSPPIRLAKHWGFYTAVVATSSIPPCPLILPSPSCCYGVELLKSCLQKVTLRGITKKRKAVRRGNVQVALNTAWQLLCQAPDQLLRRLPVILLEDACLHFALPTLVWLMISTTKGWELTKEQVLLVLKTVHDIASCPFRDLIPTSQDLASLDTVCNPVLGKDGQLVVPEAVDAKESLELEAKNDVVALDLDRVHAIVGSIVLRINYGGMKGDQSMLAKFAVLWHRRLSQDPEFWVAQIEHWYSTSDKSWEEVYKAKVLDMVGHPPEMSDAYKLREAIDFHCYPALIAKCSELVPEEISSAVWWHRSSINTKSPICKADSPYDPSYPEGPEPSESYHRERTQETWLRIKDSWERLTSASYWRALPPQQPAVKKQKKEAKSEKTITQYFVKGNTSQAALDSPTGQEKEEKEEKEDKEDKEDKADKEDTEEKKEKKGNTLDRYLKKGDSDSWTSEHLSQTEPMSQTDRAKKTVKKNTITNYFK